MVKYYTQQIIHKDIISLSINGEILERVDDNCWCDKEGNLEVMDSIEDVAKKKDYSGRVNLLENQLDSDNEFILGIYFYRYMGSGKAGQIWLGKMTTPKESEDVSMWNNCIDCEYLQEFWRIQDKIDLVEYEELSNPPGILDLNPMRIHYVKTLSGEEYISILDQLSKGVFNYSVVFKK